MKKKIAPDSFKKVAGGGGVRWSPEEELSLMGFLCNNNFHCRNFQDYEWDEAVNDLNKIYKNNRSIAACKLRVTPEKIRDAINQKLI